MSLTRCCGTCHTTIRRKHYIEITLCVYETDGPEIQDRQELSYNDFCDACVLSGRSVQTLLSRMKYKARRNKR